MERLQEIRYELWNRVQTMQVDTTTVVQGLQEEGNTILLELANRSEDDLGNCAICKEELYWNTLAKDEVGLIRLDSVRRLWCEKCTDSHDSIDWDKQC